MSALDWEGANLRDKRRQPSAALRVLGGLERSKSCKHDWSEWESPPDTFATVERTCTLCGRPDRKKLVLSQLAQTPEERRAIRGAARYRRGHALTPEGQLNLLYKQRRQNVRD